MNLHRFLLTALLLLLLNYASAWEDEDFFKICPSRRCSKHGPEIRFPFRLSTDPTSCGAPGMQLSCSVQSDTILDHPVLGSCKVTAIYYRHGVMNVIPLDSSSNCPLQKVISTNQSTDVYEPVPWDFLGSVLLSCPSDSVDTNQDGIVGPNSCPSLSNNASQFWYLVLPQTDMSTLPFSCVVVAKFIPIPYTYDKNGPKFETVFGRPLFKDKAKRAIYSGETALSWHLNNVTNACQTCEKEGRHCGFSSNKGQVFCQHHGIVFQAQIPHYGGVPTACFINV